MSQRDYKYDDPTNHVVCEFESEENAGRAQEALVHAGFSKKEVHILHGKSAAEEVDTSAKWFADTDKEIKKFERHLRTGAIVLSVSVRDCDCPDKVHTIMKQHGGKHITHFGEWVTEVMR